MPTIVNLPNGPPSIENHINPAPTLTGRSIQKASAPPSTRLLTLQPIGSLYIRLIQAQNLAIHTPSSHLPQIEFVLTNRDNRTFRSIFSQSSPAPVVLSANDNTLMHPFNETLELRLYDTSELNLIYPRAYHRQKENFLHLHSPQRQYVGACYGYKVHSIVVDGQIVREVWHEVSNNQKQRAGALQLSLWFEANKESQRERDLDVLLVNSMHEGSLGMRYFSSLAPRAEVDEINLAMSHVNRLIQMDLIEDVKLKPQTGGLHYMVMQFRRTHAKLSEEAVQSMQQEEVSVHSSMMNSQRFGVGGTTVAKQQVDPHAKG